MDEIAERIRALGFPAPASYQQFAKLTVIKKEETNVPDAKAMIKQLVEGQKKHSAARGIFTVVNEANDQPTADLLTRRMESHEKNAWMLRSLLEE